MTITKTDLLGRMRRGRKYTATQLAQLAGVSRPAVAGMLHTLVDEGRLRASRTQARVVHFELEAPDALRTGGQDAPPVSTSIAVARFRITRTVEGPLSGYDSELATQRRLAMLARDRSR